MNEQLPDSQPGSVEGVFFGSHQARTSEGWGAVQKWIEDKVIAALALLLLLLAPLFLVVPVVIKLDSPGPVFFRQARIGRNGSRFEALKFRSIYSVLPQGTWEANPERNDRRVTRVGRILRRTSLDEMPRLIDVLRGDMSIVGPRPDSMHHYPVWRLYPELAALDLEREVVKPGIIWWAHIGGGRGGLETAEAVRQLIERDLEYIRNWSVFVDLRIIVRAVFSRYGAL